MTVSKFEYEQEARTPPQHRFSFLINSILYLGEGSDCQIGVGDLKLVQILLLAAPVFLTLSLFASEALVFLLYLLELGSFLSAHLVLEHASHAVHGQCLLSISSKNITWSL